MKNCPKNIEMKTLLYLSLILISVNLYSQKIEDRLEDADGVKIAEIAKHSATDTIPVVVNIGDQKKQSNVLYFLNGKQVNEQVVGAINPEKIADIKIEKAAKEDSEFGEKGRIYITTKENYTPKLISLNALKAKYVDLENDHPSIFMMNERIINTDYDDYLVDEKYILKIEVQSIVNGKEDVDINVVRLVTRSKENIAKANTIRLRGNDL